MKTTSGLKFLSQLLGAIIFIFGTGSAIAQGLQCASLPIDIAVGTATVITGTYLHGSGMLFSNSIDVSALNTTLGAYCRKNLQILLSKMVLALNLQDMFTVLGDVKDELPLPRLTVGNLMQPNTDPSQFNPSLNALSFSGRILKVRPWKVDLLIYPQILERTWLGLWMQPGSKNKQIPFEAFIMNYIIQKIHEDMRLQAAYRGVYNGSGTSPIDCFDGVITKLKAERTAGNLTAVATGVITNNNIVASLLAIYDSLSEPYKDTPTMMVVNSQIFDWYVRKFSPITNTSLVGTDSLAANQMAHVTQFPISGTNAVLKREPGMGTSQFIYCTPKENMYYGCDVFGEEGNIETQLFERSIKLLIDAKSGVEIGQVDSDCIAVNDQN